MKVGMESSGRTSGRDDLDFDAEARALWARLGIDPNSKTPGYNDLDPVYKHPGGGSIYVGEANTSKQTHSLIPTDRSTYVFFNTGNQTAASSLAMLESHRISHVVNCTSGSSKLPNYHERSLKYMEFPITFWANHTDDSDASILKFASKLFTFIDSALEQGQSVLVHCLAGAHRAGLYIRFSTDFDMTLLNSLRRNLWSHASGTTGCLCLMHYADLPAMPAITMAKQCRRVIDPIGMLPEYLLRFERAKKNFR